jgi:hypothetical protein
MASTCAIAAPDDPASLAGPPLSRPEGLAPWSAASVAGIKHSHKFQFSPVNASSDGWRSAIYASQFRASCDRLLLVEDDLTKAGLGFTAKLWGVALLVAMRDNRVLVEVRMVKEGNGTRADGFERPRWCDRAPFTLQCLYEAWTHCPLPGPNATVVRPGGRPLKVAKWPHDEPYVRTGIGRIHRQGMFWYGAKSNAAREAGRFLFRPRRWIVDIADCVMLQARLTPRNFLNVHIRYSVEKSKEGQRLGVSLPDLEAYDVIAETLASDLGVRKVFLQTASPLALERFQQFTASHGLKLSYTNNTRSQNDAWGGWKGGLEMEQAAVAAINAHIGAQSVASVTPDLSLWTLFLSWTYGADGQSVASSSFCCGEHCKKMKSGSGAMTIFSAPNVFDEKGLPTLRTRCRERGREAKIKKSGHGGEA